ncbi:MAG: hypothetical protein J1F35_00715 [Erysipelotrichales bacterium]|nr:hypothetical protein [Erysipelotrichales bacterium]
MTEIERTNEFLEQLIDAEEMIYKGAKGLNDGIPIGEAKRQISGLEKNIKITKIEPIEYLNNPYLKNIEIKDWIVGNIYLSYANVFEEYKTYTNNSRKRDPKSLTTIYDLSYFPKDIILPALGTVFPYTKWMGVEPGEINTFSSFIEEASGKVLLMGCGLGYVAYMLSLKDNVDEVTVIELDSDVKAMFDIYLKPQMNNKINVVLGDAIKFLEEEDISSYQYCSVDIWHGITEMFPFYLKCLILEEKHPNTKFHYWLEDDLHVTIEKGWIKLIKRLINNKLTEGKPEIFADIAKMQNIETIEDVKRFMMEPKKPMIKEWALNNQEIACNPEYSVKSLYRHMK